MRVVLARATKGQLKLDWVHHKSNDTAAAAKQQTQQSDTKDGGGSCAPQLNRVCSFVEMIQSVNEPKKKMSNALYWMLSVTILLLVKLSWRPHIATPSRLKNPSTVPSSTSGLTMRQSPFPIPLTRSADRRKTKEHRSAT